MELSLIEIYEQVKKKISVSPFERFELDRMLGKDIDADYYVKLIYDKYALLPLNKFMAYRHIPIEFKKAFDKSDNARVVGPGTKSSFLLERLLDPKNSKQGYEKAKTFEAKFERYILNNFIVFWVDLEKPIGQGMFWLIKLKI